MTQSETATLLQIVRSDADLLEVSRAFRALVQQRNQAETDVTAAVAAMRRRMASWQEIATGLGVTKQAAQQRYGS